LKVVCYCRWFRWWSVHVDSQQWLDNGQYIRHVNLQHVNKPDFQHCRLLPAIGNSY